MTAQQITLYDIIHRNGFVHAGRTAFVQDGRRVSFREHLERVDSLAAAEDGGEFGSQHLNGNFAVVLQIVGEVDVCHATFTQVAFDSVSVRKRRR